MTFDRSTFATLTAAQRRAIVKVLGSAELRFTSLVELAGLDPRNELTNLNLGPIEVYPDENLAGYNFSGSSLERADFRGVDLTGACVDGCDFLHADLRGTKMTRQQRQRARDTGARIGRLSVSARTARTEEIARRDAVLKSAMITAAGEAFPDAELVGVRLTTSNVVTHYGRR